VTETAAASPPGDGEGAQVPDETELQGNVVQGSLRLTLIYQLQSRSRRRRGAKEDDEQQFSGE